MKKSSKRPQAQDLHTFVPAESFEAWGQSQCARPRVSEHLEGSERSFFSFYCQDDRLLRKTSVNEASVFLYHQRCREEFDEINFNAKSTIQWYANDMILLSSTCHAAWLPQICLTWWSSYELKGGPLLYKDWLA